MKTKDFIMILILFTFAGMLLYIGKSFDTPVIVDTYSRTAIEGYLRWVKDGDYAKGEHPCDREYGHLEYYTGEEWIKLK